MKVLKNGQKTSVLLVLLAAICIDASGRQKTHLNDRPISDLERVNNEIIDVTTSLYYKGALFEKVVASINRNDSARDALLPRADATARRELGKVIDEYQVWFAQSDYRKQLDVNESPYPYLHKASIYGHLRLNAISLADGKIDILVEIRTKKLDFRRPLAEQTEVHEGIGFTFNGDQTVGQLVRDYLTKCGENPRDFPWRTDNQPLLYDRRTNAKITAKPTTVLPVDVLKKYNKLQYQMNGHVSITAAVHFADFRLEKPEQCTVPIMPTDSQADFNAECAKQQYSYQQDIVLVSFQTTNGRYATPGSLFDAAVSRPSLTLELSAQIREFVQIFTSVNANEMVVDLSWSIAQLYQVANGGPLGQRKRLLLTVTPKSRFSARKTPLYNVKDDGRTLKDILRAHGTVAGPLNDLLFLDVKEISEAEFAKIDDRPMSAAVAPGRAPSVNAARLKSAIKQRRPAGDPMKPLIPQFERTGMGRSLIDDQDDDEGEHRSAAGFVPDRFSPQSSRRRSAVDSSSRQVAFDDGLMRREQRSRKSSAPTAIEPTPSDENDDDYTVDLVGQFRRAQESRRAEQSFSSPQAAAEAYASDRHTSAGVRTNRGPANQSGRLSGTPAPGSDRRRDKQNRNQQ